jgi:MOSC domain-containing protein YiiM
VTGTNDGRVASVSRDGAHRFGKPAVGEIVLLEGLGVEGDSHAGTTVQHLHRIASDPKAPNLRQVHLIPEELFSDLEELEFAVAPGELGENITTRGIDVLALPRGTRLHLGEAAIVEVTGLRNPCTQINRFQPGLMKALIGKNDNGDVVRRAGIMGVVVTGGTVHPGDAIAVELPDGEPASLEVV